MKALIWAAMLLASLTVSMQVHAEEFPQKAVRLVVPYPPGGGTDITARTISVPLAVGLGQPVVVENRPGASGMVGTEFVAKATPDGYTVVIFTDTNTIVPALYPNLRHDPLRDFEPVAQLAVGPLVIFAHPQLPAASLSELVLYARQRPGTLAYASSGNGSSQHLAFEMLKMATGLQITHVPYKGGGQAINDVVAGQVPLGILGLSAALPHIKTGRVKPLAVTGAKRSPLLPNTPSVSETVPGFDAVQWFAVMAPHGTPQNIVRRLHAEFVKALKDPLVQERLIGLGLQTTPDRSPSELAAFVREDLRRWPPIVKSAGIKVD